MDGESELRLFIKIRKRIEKEKDGLAFAIPKNHFGNLKCAFAWFLCISKEAGLEAL